MLKILFIVFTYASLEIPSILINRVTYPELCGLNSKEGETISLKIVTRGENSKK